MHEIGGRIKTGGVSLIMLSRDFLARRIARAKSTIKGGQSAILPRKSGPGEIFEKKDCRK